MILVTSNIFALNFWITIGYVTYVFHLMPSPPWIFQGISHAMLSI